MNKKSLLQFSVCIFTGITLLAGCSSQEGTNLEIDTAAINDIESQFSSCVNDGDVDRCMSLWTEDAVRMPPNEPTNIGKDQIRVAMKGVFDQFTLDLDSTNEEVEVAGDWAFSRGTYTVAQTPKEGGQPVFFDGKYITILQRQADGSWKIHRDIYNFNVAPGGE